MPNLEGKAIRFAMWKAAKIFEDETGGELFISEVPSDPEERKKWRDELDKFRIDLILASKASCELCKHQYSSVEDFIARKPRHTSAGRFVCDACWRDYVLHKD